MAAELFESTERVTRDNVNNRVSKINSMVVGTSLYNNLEGTSGTITLSDTYSNYDVIKVVFGANNIIDAGLFYTDISHQIAISTPYAYNTTNNLVGINFYGSVLYFSDTTVSFLRQCLGKLTTSGLTLTADTSLKVYKILGYKY